MNTKGGVATFTGFQLEQLCKEILIANNWVVENLNPTINIGCDADIIAREPTTQSKVVFEVKYTRNTTYPTPALKVATERLVKLAHEIQVSKAVLIVATNIKPEIQSRVEKQFNIQIINLDGLLSLASVDLELLGRLIKLCEVDLSERKLSEDLAHILHPKVIPTEFNESGFSNIETQGNSLKNRLKSIPHGREGCYEYEDTMSEILQYLFDGDLKGWHQQERTTDDLHRYDLICRVIDKSMVWRFISSNLDSRYVLFEFKNYKDKIGQAQIYSTEKYLFEKAKRKVCFLTSREGPSDNALIACQGAMREHGKLIINLDDDVICSLIDSKISGDDPNEILFERVDQFLMKLPR
ncbi:restriction endonuclease [Vibrio sp. J1-1]|uniref:restriction endonuclease n=1 Tax=Vibrio sp. J1-1 TaxID=2912251 RepID=UPI001F01EE45|nr:restriction endonuclease [Vibrio sp. J1-1]MCF7484192.1 restriction endonuclease [Vibrio sp. J1-1]